MEVHNCLGCGFQEVIYQRALLIELNKAGLESIREFDIPVIYKGLKIGTRRADFLIENKILVEIKAVSKLDLTHLAQGRNYLEASDLDTGLLFNFGTSSLQYKRLYRKTGF